MANNTRRLVTLLVILIVVAIVAAMLGVFSRDTDVPDEVKPEERELVDVSEDEITAFAIERSDAEENFQLVREGSDWYVEQDDQRFRANMERLDDLLDQVPDLESTRLVTSDPEKHADYKLDEENAIRLKVFTGGDAPVVSLFVGNSTERREGCFVRFMDSDKVYSTNENIKLLVGFFFRDYRTKTPWDFTPATVESVTIRPLEAEGEPRTFTYTDGFWKTAAGDNANQNLLTEFAEKISNLRASDFAAPEDDTESDILELEPQVVFRTATGEYSLAVGGQQGAQYFVRAQDGGIYLVAEVNLKPYLELDFEALEFDDTAETEDTEATAEDDAQFADEPAAVTPKSE